MQKVPKAAEVQWSFYRKCTPAASNFEDRRYSGTEDRALPSVQKVCRYWASAAFFKLQNADYASTMVKGVLKATK